MHFHLPKPLHGWREFAGEVGIIVLGILVALGAEQVVQAREWQRRVSEAREALNKEIADAAGSAQERINFEKCARAHLDEVQAKVMAAGPKLTEPLLATRYYTIIRPWSQNVWHAMSASGVLEHMPQSQMLGYSAAFDVIAGIREEMVTEQDSISDLALLTTLRGPFDAITRDRLLTAISRARRENSSIVRDSQQLIDAADELGVRPSRMQQIPCYSLDQKT